MGGKARLGRWVLLAIIVVTVLSELVLTGLSIQAGRFKGSQIGRILLTGWLLWRVWDGVGWARWLLATLCFAGALLAAIFVLASPVVEGRPGVAALLRGVGGSLAVLGVGFASPWVGAYQAARRGGAGAEPAAEGDPTRRMDPAKLPEVLRPFIPLYEKWGDVRSDTTRHALMDRALSDPAEMAELKEWHAKLSRIDPASWEGWFGGPIRGDENYERAKVYFTDLLMYGELEIHNR